MMLRGIVPVGWTSTNIRLNVIALLILCFTAYCAIDRSDGNFNAKFTVVNNGRMSSYTILMVFRGITVKECMMHCISHLKCATFNFNKRTKECELSELEFDEFEADTDTAEWKNYGSPKKVNGNWSEWKEQGGCTRTCGAGMKLFYRLCDNPKPDYGGALCVGPVQKSESCNTEACPPPCLMKDKSFESYFKVMKFEMDNADWEVCAGYCNKVESYGAWNLLPNKYCVLLNNQALQIPPVFDGGTLCGYKRNCKSVKDICQDEGFRYQFKTAIDKSITNINTPSLCLYQLELDANQLYNAWMWQRPDKCLLRTDLLQISKREKDPSSVVGLKSCHSYAQLPDSINQQYRLSVFRSLCEIHKIEFKYDIIYSDVLLTFENHVIHRKVYELEYDADDLYSMKKIKWKKDTGIQRLVIAQIRRSDGRYCVRVIPAGINAIDQDCWVNNYAQFFHGLRIEYRRSDNTIKDFFIQGAQKPNGDPTNCKDDISV